ncbi:hypothetical protein DFJ73DRAFT_795537 [Zopfochytrium polystomum]|nr:hypothetical protein DFJ73DRAFT_795537 [Zopfochytrium polystomum]
MTTLYCTSLVALLSVISAIETLIVNSNIARPPDSSSLYVLGYPFLVTVAVQFLILADQTAFPRKSTWKLLPFFFAVSFPAVAYLPIVRTAKALVAAMIHVLAVETGAFWFFVAYISNSEFAETGNILRTFATIGLFLVSIIILTIHQNVFPDRPLSKPKTTLGNEPTGSQFKISADTSRSDAALAVSAGSLPSVQTDSSTFSIGEVVHEALRARHNLDNYQHTQLGSHAGIMSGVIVTILFFCYDTPLQRLSPSCADRLRRVSVQDTIMRGTLLVAGAVIVDSVFFGRQLWMQWRDSRVRTAAEREDFGEEEDEARSSARPLTFAVCIRAVSSLVVRLAPAAAPLHTSSAACANMSEKKMPPPISVAGGPGSDDTVPPTPTVTEQVGEDEVKPSMEAVNRRRGGVCITEPNFATLSNASAIRAHRAIAPIA